MTNTVTDTEIAAFVQMAREKTGLNLGYETLQKYIRIFAVYGDDYERRRVFGFIDRTNGNLLRADGWKRPNLTLKNPIQGNLFDADKGSGAMRNDARKL
jgi:hypothetical protein